MKPNMKFSELLEVEIAKLNADNIDLCLGLLDNYEMQTRCQLELAKESLTQEYKQIPVTDWEEVLSVIKQKTTDIEKYEQDNNLLR